MGEFAIFEASWAIGPRWVASRYGTWAGEKGNSDVVAPTSAPMLPAHYVSLTERHNSEDPRTNCSHASAAERLNARAKVFDDEPGSALYMLVDCSLSGLDLTHPDCEFARQFQDHILWRSPSAQFAFKPNTQDLRRF